jgi:tRNA-2-methylthio-N6-dimethylallyladenosine synthase
LDFTIESSFTNIVTALDSPEPWIYGGVMKGFVKIFTYGCQMNDLDSMKMYSELSQIGYEPTSETQLADIIILNTCSVRQKAYEKAMSNLGRLRTHKRMNPSLVIAITGCVAQQEKENILEKMPHVDIILGTHQLHQLSGIIEKNKLQVQDSIIKTEFDEFIPSMNIIPDARFMDSPHRAYINIMQGCDNFCSYCIVPFVRGREISRKCNNILQEVKEHASRGVKEVFLLGQNVNSYNGGMTFPDLLRNIYSIEGINRIRFTTSHPKDVSNSLIACFAELDKLCSHIHLPFQSGSNSVLEAMNRRYTRESYLTLVNQLKEVRPDISFSGDVIVGFPGETSEAYLETLDVMKAVRFDVLYSFKYSERPGTCAADLDDNVSIEEKRARLERLQSLQREITLENNKARVGKIFGVLVDGESSRRNNQIQGRTTQNIIVNFEADPSLVGKMANVKITRANQNSLTGELSRI